MKTNLKKLLLAVLFLGVLIPFYSYSQEVEGGDNSGDDEKYGSNPENCKMNLSLYIEFYRQKNYDDAYQPWSIVFRECPKASKNIYIHGPTIVWNKINKTKDPTLKGKYADTLMLMYDQRIANYNDEGKVLGRKGIDFNKLYPKKKAESIKILEKSVDIEGVNSDPAVLSVLFMIAADLLKENGLTVDQFLEYYNKCSDVISNQLSASPDSASASKLQNAQDNIDLLLVNSGKATCEMVVPVFTKKFESNKEDISTLKTIVKLLSKIECTDTKLYSEATEQLHKLEPSALSAYSLAQLFVKASNFSKAATYYLQAIEMETDNAKKSQYYYELALVSGTKLGQLSNARTYAFKAAEYKKDWGKPYILIGTLYAQSAKDCGENAFFQSLTYIAAVDKFAQARAIDPSCSEEAGKYIASYSAYFPTLEEIFFNNMQEGNSYTIGCWINESIKIKKR